MAAQPTDVIDWQEAMQQTGDDEEFLRELLADLRQETDTQVANIEQIIQVRLSLRVRMGFWRVSLMPWQTASWSSLVDAPLTWVAHSPSLTPFFSSP